MKRLFGFFSFVLLVCGASGALPVIQTIDLDPSRPTLEIDYTLDAPAIVTLDVQTNAGDTVWASIGAANVLGDGTAVTGDAFRFVAAGNALIRWKSRKSWRDHEVAAGGLRAVLTAYPPDLPPDYLVVDLTPDAVDRVRYYPDVNWLPGGILANEAYRTTKLVLRRCAAKGVTWTMGQEIDRVADCDAPHAVTLADDFYIAVFETTQKQWETVVGNFDALQRRGVGDTLPVHNVSYAIVRETADHTGNSAAYWPANPGSESFLGKLRIRVGGAIDFELPTVAQWEFAARSGTSSDQWPNGATYPTFIGSGDPSIPASFNRENLGIEPCGSHQPNLWGIYDMNGSMWEWCLDWYEADIRALNGKVNIDPHDGTKTLSGETGSFRCFRGGSWTVESAAWIRHTLHWRQSPTVADWNGGGFRVSCPVQLK